MKNSKLVLLDMMLMNAKLKKCLEIKKDLWKSRLFFISCPAAATYLLKSKCNNAYNKTAPNLNALSAVYLFIYYMYLYIVFY